MSWGIKKWEGKGSCGQVSHVPHLFPPFYAPIWVSVPPLITKRLRYRLNGSEQRIKVKGKSKVLLPSATGCGDSSAHLAVITVHRLDQAIQLLFRTETQ